MEMPRQVRREDLEMTRRKYCLAATSEALGEMFGPLWRRKERRV
jgi:hypothetical protein